MTDKSPADQAAAVMCRASGHTTFPCVFCREKAAALDAAGLLLPDWHTKGDGRVWKVEHFAILETRNEMEAVLVPLGDVQPEGETDV